MAYPHQHHHHRSQFGDTTMTKVFVGGLAWETPTHEMRRYFEQFGDILEAVIITDKNTNKSKGYGFVTFRDPESAQRACADPNPVIDGRRANCNIASLGRPRPSPPRARTQSVNPYQGPGGPLLPPPPPSMPPLPPPPPMVYPHYGYPTYPPDYGYHQALYNPQYYGASSSLSPSSMGSPYFYGYSMQTSPRPGAHQRPSYVYYPTHMQEPSYSPYPLPSLPSPTRHNPSYHPSSSTELQTPQHTTSAETEVPESPNT